MRKLLLAFIFIFLSFSFLFGQGALRIMINNGQHGTNNETVKLTLVVPAGKAAQMMISNSESFSGATWEAFVPAKTWKLDASSDGMKHVYAKFKDKAGNTSAAISAKIFLDKTPPQNPKISINKGHPVTNKNSVLLEIQAEGATEMMVSNHGGFAGGVWKPYATTIEGWHLDGSDGMKTVYVRFRDKASNISETAKAEIKYDKTAPTIKMVVNGDEKWTNKTTVKLELTSNDAHEMMISTMGKKWMPYKPSIDITLTPPDGPKAIHAMVRDEAHNHSPAVHAEINLKTNPPVNNKIRIDHGHHYYNKPDKKVNLELHSEGAKFMMISQKQNFEGAKWEPYSSVKMGYFLEGEDGDKTIYAKFKDQAENETEVVTAHIILDRTPPQGGSISINGGAEGTNDSHVKVKITAPKDAVGMQLSQYSTFGGAGWQKIETEEIPVSLAGADGKKSVYVRFRDEAGNFGAGIEASILLDKRPPIGSSIKIDNGAEYATQPQVTLSIVSREAKEMMISDDPHFEGASWEPFASSKTLSLKGEDGLKVIGAKFRDAAGNVSAPVTAKIKLSTKPPVECKIVIDDDKEFCTRKDRRVKLSLHAKNAVKMMISNRPDFSGTNWMAYGTSRPVHVLGAGEGEQAVYAKFMSGAGNVSEVVSDKIILDYTPPKNASMRINGGAKGTNDKEGKIKVEFKAEEAVEMMFTDNKSFAGKTWEPYKTSMDWNLTGEDGMKILVAVFRDKAGNVTPKVSAQIVMDRNPPTGTVKINDGQNSTTSDVVNLKILAQEAVEMQISNSSSFGDMPWQPLVSLTKWNITTGDGVKTVYVRFRDQAGNISEVASDNIELDTKPPGEGSIVINEGKEYTTDKLGKVKIALKSEGAKFMKISNRSDFKGSNWIAYVEERDWNLLPGEGERKVNVKFKDDAGNETAPTSSIITVDYTPPSSGKIVIDNGAQYSRDKEHNVKLEIATNGADEMMLSNTSTFDGGQWEPLSTSKDWTLDPPGDGKREVYVKFRDAAGNESTPVKDEIIIDTKF